MTNILVEVDPADKSRVILNVHCFNATGETAEIADVRGEIVLQTGRGPDIKLRQPRMMTERYSSKPLPDRNTFRIDLEQPLLPDQAEVIWGVTSEDCASLNLDGLNVFVTVAQMPGRFIVMSPVRLPLWNGVRLYKSADRILNGEVRSMQGMANIKSRNGNQQRPAGRE